MLFRSVELLLEKDIDIYRDLCSHTEEIIQAVVSSVSICLAALILCFSVRTAYKRRYRIKTWWYRRKVNHDNCAVHSVYDIYLTYDVIDSSFALHELASILESVYRFRCCIPERDFPATNAPRVEITSQQMSACSMTIVVLSRHALQNTIHCFERNLARHMELHTRQMKKVVYILLDDLRDVTDADVRSIISGATTLHYPVISDRRVEFYDKLRCFIYKALKA